MKKSIPFLLLLLLIVTSDAVTIIVYKNQATQQQRNQTASITALQKQISALQNQVILNKQSTSAALSAQEVANRQIVQQKSQQELVTAAVAKYTPPPGPVPFSQQMPQNKHVSKNPLDEQPFFSHHFTQHPDYQP